MAMAYKLEINDEKIILFLRFVIVHAATIYISYLFFPTLNEKSIISFIWFSMKFLVWLTSMGIVYVTFIDFFENILKDYRKLRLTLLDRKEYNRTNLRYHLEDSRAYRNTLEKLSLVSNNYTRFLFGFQLFCIKNWIPLLTLFIIILMVFIAILI